MKYEKSCGAILFHNFPEGWKTLLLRHNQGHWAFAKGHVEGNETEEQTALREILEETGLTAQLDTGFRMVTTYSPQAGVQKDVVYFIAQVKEGNATPQLEEIQTLEWLDFDAALQALTFKNDKDIFEKAVVYFQQVQAKWLNPERRGRRMLFETARFQIEVVSMEDAAAITEVYASNPSFVQAHLQGHIVTEEWILQEQAHMKEAKFVSAKIVEKALGNTIGVLDFRVGEEAYLSLLMFHKDVQGSGAGAEVFRGFETYARTKGAQSIRLEVVLDDPQTAFPFWKKQGFASVQEVLLHWGDVTLKALQMVKKV